MAKASSSSRSAHERKPYSGGPRSANAGNGQVSISKLKSNLRQATRLLAKDKLDAQLRVETERRVESLKQELAEAEAARPASSEPASKKSEQPEKQAKSDAKGRGKKKEDQADRYRMLRHFEYQKTSRRCKKCKKELQAAEEQLEALESSANDDKAKKKLKKLRKEVDRLKTDLQNARVDAWYVETFPKSLKYVSLYPPDGYVAFELSSLPDQQAETDERAAAKMPSSKKVDEVRSYWRSVVKGRLDREELHGEPIKQKLDKKKPKTADATAADEQEADAADPDAADSEEDAASSDVELPEVDLDEDEKDDFFA